MAEVFPCEVFEISRTPFLQNTSGRLLLPIQRRCHNVGNRHRHNSHFWSCHNAVTMSTTTLWQRCHNVVVPAGKFRVLEEAVALRCSVKKMFLKRCCNVATIFSILLQTTLISFHSSKHERVTKVLSGIKHTSSLFKRTLYFIPSESSNINEVIRAILNSFFSVKDFARTKSTKSTKSIKSTKKHKSTKTQPNKSTKMQISEQK